MPGRTLIAYASRSGTTGEVAEAMARALGEDQVPVDVVPAARVTSVHPYARVIVGSAIRYGRWLPEARDFLARHASDLQSVPTALFTVHILNLGEGAEALQARQAYTAPLKALVQPHHEAFFKGSLEKSRLGFMERLVTRLVGAPFGDQRDWRAILDWVRRLP